MSQFSPRDELIYSSLENTSPRLALMTAANTGMDVLLDRNRTLPSQ